MSNTIKSSDLDSYFQLLPSPQFIKQGCIWTKRQEPIPCKNFKQKFHYYKIGKTFGMFTERILTVHEGKLFYYENDRSEITKGYCDVKNIYCGFFKTDQKYPYLVRLTNYTSISDLYFSSKDEVEYFMSLILKYSIQINFDQEFKLIEKVGQGSFAKVYVAKKKATGKMYAVKIVRKQDSNSMATLDSVKQEKAALQLCDSQYCSRYYQFYQDANHYYFVLEYIQGKSLMSVVKEQIVLTEENKITILKGVLQALDYIHYKRIADRDVKPQNIIINLETFQPKLLDFGLALFLNQNTPIQDFKRCGTMGYIAPQIMQSSQNNRIRYTSKVDMFSFGIVAHILLLGFNPLKGKNYQQTFQKNKEFNIKLDTKSINEQYGQYCSSFLQGLLEYTSSNRLSARQALNHPFINSKHNQSTKQIIRTRYQSIDFEEESAKFRHQSPLKKQKKRT